MGLAIDNNAIALSVVLPDQEMTYKHKVSVYRSVDKPELFPKILQELVKENGLQKCHCRWVLNNDQYKVNQIEAPEAEDDEMLPSVTWAVKDLLDYPVSDALIDYYPVPDECVRGNQKRLNVVSAKLSDLKPIYEQIKSAGLQVDTIDIPELALKNIMQLLDDEVMGHGLIYQINNGVILGIYRQNKLLFSRLLTGIHNLQDAMDKTTGHTIKENMLLEIQRTLDYYESQLGQPPLSTLYLQPLIVESKGLEDYLRQYLNPGIKSMDLNNMVLSLQKLSAPVQFGCLKSLGVALRIGENE